MPELLEAGTINAHGIAGLKAGLEYIQQEGLERLYTREALLTKTFYEGVRRIDGVKVYGNFDQEKRAPLVALNIRNEDAGKVSEILWEDYGIATRAGHIVPRSCTKLLGQLNREWFVSASQALILWKKSRQR